MPLPLVSATVTARDVVPAVAAGIGGISGELAAVGIADQGLGVGDRIGGAVGDILDAVALADREKAGGVRRGFPAL